MNGKLKKLTAVCLATASLFTLNACKSGGDAENANLTKVTIWTGDSHSKNIINGLVEEYNKTKGKELGIQVEYSVKDGNMAQNLEMAIASNQAPDFFTTSAVQKYAESGDVISVSDIKGGQEYINENYDEEAIEHFTMAFDGKIYKAPFYVTTTGIAYNKDMFKKYGLVDENGEAKPPKTLKEFREYAKKLTNPAEKEYGIIIPIKMSSFPTNFTRLAVASSGTSGYNFKTGKYDYTVFEPGLEAIMGMKADGSMYPGANGLDNDTARAVFAEGKIGMIFSGSYDVAVFTSQFPAKCDWDVAPLPVADENNRYKQVMANDGFVVMNKKSIERVGEDKMLEVFKWIHSKVVVSELYKQGAGIPYNVDVIENTKINDDVYYALQTFADLRKTSFALPSVMPTDLEGTPDFKTLFNSKIWMGEGSIHDLLVDLSNRSNAGIGKKFSVSTELKKENYIYPDWDVSIK